MSYAAGEILVLARLRLLGQFNGSNASRGNWGIRNKGKSNHYAVLKSGTRNRRPSGLGGARLDEHSTVIQVFQRYRGKKDGDDYKALLDLVETIETEFDKYPRIEDTTGGIIFAEISESREIVEIGFESAAGPDWLMQELICEWREETFVTLAE